MSEFEYEDFGVDDDFTEDQPVVDPLAAEYMANPALTTAAIVQETVRREVAAAQQQIIAQTQEIATQASANYTADKVTEALLKRTGGDFDRYRDAVAARLEATPGILDEEAISNPAVAEQRIFDQYILAKREATQTSAAEEWHQIKKAAIDSPGAYWDPRRKLLDVPRSEGGYKE